MTMMKCEICQGLIFRNSNAQKYCKRCAKMIQKMQIALWKKIKREKEKEKMNRLGTTSFSDKRSKSFGVEYKRIQNEIKKLGIKRQFT
jgi:hypothetical protein